MNDLPNSLIDPRGRCNRKGLLVAATVLLSIEIAAAAAMWLAIIPADHPALLAGKVALLWIAFAVTAQRLHDLGRSAWHILWAMLALFIWSFAAALTAAVVLGPDQVMPDKTGFWVVFAAIALPMLAALLWLHFAPGQPHANRFGPVPDGLGFARPESHSRRAPQGAIPA